MTEYFTDFGMAEAPSQHEATIIAYERWERGHFERGGWRPMTAEEFETMLQGKIAELVELAR